MKTIYYYLSLKYLENMYTYKYIRFTSINFRTISYKMYMILISFYNNKKFIK